MPREPSRNDLKRALDRITKPNEYDEIIKQVTPTIIPTRLIEHVAVHYNDGTIVSLSAADITSPIPVKQAMSKEEKMITRAQMADVKVYINTDALRDEVEDYIDTLFSKFELL